VKVLKKAIKWDDIVSDVIKTVFAVIVIGAATIVWQGATSVEAKVNESKAEMRHMIEGTANELASLKAEMSLVRSNLQLLRADIPNMIEQKMIYGPPLPPHVDTGVTLLTNNPTFQMQQKVYQSDLVDKLQLKK
jgi:hypothetical protein